MSNEQETRPYKLAPRTFSYGSRAQLLAVAALLHVATTVAAFAAGRYGLLPEFFGPDGVAGSFASDGRLYMLESRLLVEELWTKGLGAWLDAPFPVHVKLYSLCFAALGWCFGFTIVSAEPLNLLCYLSILTLIYWLGKECFDTRAGLLAAAAVALWPSLLLHTTQLLKDPLFIVAMLALVATCVRLLKSRLAFAGGMSLGMAGGAAVVAVWLLRDEMWVVMLAIVLIAAVLLAARGMLEGRLQAGNVFGAALLLVILFCIPSLIKPYREPGVDSPAGRAIKAQPIRPECEEPLIAARAITQSGTMFARLRTQVTRSRILATCVPGSGSNIDADVRLNNVGEIILYLPRAVLIGFFAPFPTFWFAQGTHVGFAGRALSGAEMLATYLIELLALAALWVRRERLAVWLLALVSAAGMTALGLVMPNIGTLYRLRYVFWTLLVVLAAGGVAWIISRREERG